MRTEVKTEAYYAIELLTEYGWIIQSWSKRKTLELVERNRSEWKREEPWLKLRLVRVKTTWEVVG